MDRVPRKILAEFLLILFVITFTGCGGELPGLSPTSTQSPTATSTSESVAEVTLTSTPLPPIGLFLAPAEADAGLAAAIQTRLSGWIPEMGYRFQVRPSISQSDLDQDDFRLVVALSPMPGIDSLVASNPGIRFITVGITDLQPADNLVTIGLQANRLDQQGFIAGYTAAMITPDWRVGVIGNSSSEITVAARLAFRTGVKFYCGLCQQIYPPFEDVPLYFELGADADTSGWGAAADYMISHEVETVYVVPGAGDEAMLRHLATAGINIIGGGPPLPDIKDHWVASFQFDLLAAFIDAWPDFAAGTSANEVAVPLQVGEINSELLSPGKQRLVEEKLAEVLAGYIDLGVDVGTNP